MKSTFLTLDTKDFIRGLIMATIVPVLTIIQQSVAAGELVFNLKAIGIAAISGFLGYLLKNLFTDTTKVAVQRLAKQNVTITEDFTQKIVTPENVLEVQNSTQPTK